MVKHDHDILGFDFGHYLILTRFVECLAYMWGVQEHIYFWAPLPHRDC